MCITHASAGACALLRRVYAVMLRSLPCPGLITNVSFNYLILDQLKRSVDKFCCCVAILSTVCTATQENQTKSLNYLVF